MDGEQGIVALTARAGRSNARRPRPVYYPEADGKPMAETPLHLGEMLRLIQVLMEWYRALPNVLVGGNILLYFEEGNRHRHVSPDVYVAIGVPKRPLRHEAYLLWVEGAPPTFVIEVTSRTTQREDRYKRDIYRQIGVREYVQYDPSGTWLHPPLQAWRLDPNGDTPLAEAPGGGLLSEALGLRLVLETWSAGAAEAELQLQFYDLRSGARLMTRDEVAEQQATVAEQRATVAERQATIAQRQVTIAQRQATIAEQQVTIAQQQATIAQRQATVAEQLLTAETERANLAEQLLATEAEARRLAEARAAEAARRIAALESRDQPQEPPQA